jgi:hypothetical protein
MEKCFQCGVGALQHPITAVVGVDEVAKDPEKVLTILEIKEDNRFVLVPICVKCWHEPKIDGHFFFRQDSGVGLARSGSSELG